MPKPYSETTIAPIINQLHSKFQFKLYENYTLIENGHPVKEADFLLVFREIPFCLLIEAKGGKLTFKNNKWTNGFGAEQDDPFNQAISATHKIRKKINLDFSEMDYLVWFTECRVDKVKEGFETHYFDRSSDAFYLNKLTDYIQSKIKKFKPNPSKQKKAIEILDKEAEQTRNWNEEIVHKINSIDSHSKTFFPEALFSVFELNKNVAVNGFSGTGKTFLAKQSANRFSENGKKVLLLCYNILLGKYLMLYALNTKNKTFDADSYESFIKKCGLKASPPPKEKKERDKYYAQILPKEFADYVSKSKTLKHKYDVIIIDEGQDFGNLQIKSLQNLLKPEGHFIYFYDELQQLYQSKNKHVTKDYTQISLNINLRNAKKINAKINKEFLSPKGKKMEAEHSIDEGRCNPIRFNEEADLVLKLKKEVKEILERYNMFAPGNTMLLLVGDNIEDYRFIENIDFDDLGVNIKEMKSTEEDFDFQNTIYYSRPSIVKGLEFPNVLVIDPAGWKSKYGSANIEAHQYIAIGRAQLGLFIFEKVNA